MHDEKNAKLDENHQHQNLEVVDEENKNDDDVIALNDDANNNNNSEPILYENDFDLYNLLKDMIGSNKLAINNNLTNIYNNNKMPYIKRMPSLNTRLAKPNKIFNPNLYQRKIQYKNYTKSLTARLLDSHFTNGKSEWCLIENGIDFYRSKIKCIGTDMNDFDYGDLVYFDLQPLSTRIKLMCKLIIIIQGACLERSGPPKLVQDRCVQFDGNNLSLQENEHLNSSNKIKSNSLENLLVDETENKIAEETSNDLSNEIKISIYGKGSNSSVPISVNISRKNSKRSIKQTNFSNDSTNSSNNGAVSDDEIYSSNNENNSNKKSKSNDLEHYFKYRNYSFRDYASAPYYQYSSVKEMQFFDKSTNTDQIDNDESEKLNSKSTSTDDLLNSSYLGYFSKSQLMSSKSLFEKRSSLVDSSTNFDDDSQSNMIPINIPLKFSYKKRFDTSNSQIKPKVVKTISNDIFNSNEEDDKLTRLIKMGPKKSSEWTIYKRRSKLTTDGNNPNNNNNKLLSRTTTTTTTTITTTTTTKTTKVVETLINEEDETNTEATDINNDSSNNKDSSVLNDSFISQTTSIINDGDNQILSDTEQK